MKMNMIVGLGNPGVKYKNTKHNAGFEVLDLLAKKMNLTIDKKKKDNLISKGFVGDADCLLVKPQSFMNLSGEALLPLVSFFKIQPQQMIIVYDDFSLNKGQLRIRKEGSAGGHNGIKSLIKTIGTEFVRVRVGIGAPENDIVDYVLSKFGNDDLEIMELAYKKAAESLIDIVENGVEFAMNKYN
jgi:peptidyl-tRNA hydrolase, PTH1 family